MAGTPIIKTLGFVPDTDEIVARRAAQIQDEAVQHAIDQGRELRVPKRFPSSAVPFDATGWVIANRGRISDYMHFLFGGPWTLEGKNAIVILPYSTERIYDEDGVFTGVLMLGWIDRISCCRTQWPPSAIYAMRGRGIVAHIKTPQHASPPSLEWFSVYCSEDEVISFDVVGDVRWRGRTGNAAPGSPRS